MKRLLLLLYVLTTASLAQAQNVPTTTQTSYCNRRIDIKVSPGSLSDPAAALPIVAELYYDLDKDGKIGPSAEETTPRASINIEQYEVTRPMVVPDSSQMLQVLYRSENNAFEPFYVVPVSANDGQEIKLGGSIEPGSTTVQYFVVSAPENAYPFDLAVYEDKDSNGVIDSPADGLLSKFPVYAPDGFSYTTDMHSNKSKAIVTAASQFNCSWGYETITTVQSPLPVYFSSFTAKRQGTDVYLTWTTAMEQNNKGFYIQRSDGGSAWEIVAFVPALSSSSTAAHDYSFIDANRFSGVSQYRLLQEDLDGSRHQSTIRSVRGISNDTKLVLYPNPSATGTVTLLLNGQSSDVRVLDATGRLVQQFRGVRGSSLTVRNLSSGFYTVQVFDNATKKTASLAFIIQRF